MGKKQYRIRNWSDYNKSLVGRGKLTLWFSEEMLSKWSSMKAAPGMRGRPIIYCDAIIESALTLRALFKLPLRATQGLLESLIELSGMSCAMPDYSTLCKRGKKLNLSLKAVPRSGEKLDIVIDSTGLKVYGEGEWKMRQHGKQKRRTWRKVHIAINAKSFGIEGVLLTEASCHDGEMLPDLLNAVNGKITNVYGDGAYDHDTNYDYLSEHHINGIIPPRKDAKLKQHGNCKATPHPRDENIRIIRKIGRKNWKKQSDYHTRSLVETTMFCLKTAFGDKLQNRLFETQATEVAIKCNILNQFTILSRPQPYVIKNAA